MKHKPEAVERMARLIHDAIYGTPDSWTENTAHELYEDAAVAVLDAMVPPQLRERSSPTIMIGDEETVYIVSHYLAILNGTAKIGGDDGKD